MNKNKTPNDRNWTFLTSNNNNNSNNIISINHLGIYNIENSSNNNNNNNSSSILNSNCIIGDSSKRQLISRNHPALKHQRPGNRPLSVSNALSWME